MKNTNDRILVEASPVDKIWETGLAQNDKNAEIPCFWKGLNLLGYALMETRYILNKIGEFTPLENSVLPSWLAHPEIERCFIIKFSLME